MIMVVQAVTKDNNQTAHGWFIEIECETMNIHLDTQENIYVIRLDGNQMIRIKPNMLTIAYNLKSKNVHGFSNTSSSSSVWWREHLIELSHTFLGYYGF